MNLLKRQNISCVAVGDRKLLDFIKKDLHLCSRVEQKSYGF